MLSTQKIKRKNVHQISMTLQLLSFHSRKLREAINLTLSHTVEPHPYTIYLKILQLCTDLKSTRSGHFIHSRIITNGFQTNTSLSTRLIIFYSKINEMGNARKVFDQMSDRTVVTWTALISGYSHNSDYEKSLRVFSTMHCEGPKANQFTYASAFSSCTRLLCLELGKQIQGCVQKRRFVGNLFVQSALVDLHSKCGDMSDACRVFESMETRDLVSWNAMIGGYVAQEMSNDAILVFCLMLVEGILPDVFTFGSVLRATAGKNKLAKANIVHGYIIKFGLGSHKYLNGSLIDAYIKCGDLDCATQVFNNMQNKDLISCTSLIKGYVREDTNCTSALRLFHEVQKYTAIDAVLLCSMINICAKTASLSLGRQLHTNVLKYQTRRDLATCNALIDMYSKAGAIADAKSVFDEMEGKNVISWTSLIAGYGKHGYGHKAYELYLRMRDKGLKPNDVTFLSLLFACSHNGLTIQGWECFSDMIIEYDIFPRSEHYTCLVDLLGRAGRLEEAYDLMCRVSSDGDVSLLGAMLGACSTYGNVNLGEIVARRLFKLEPKNLANYVVLSGIYAAAGLWDNARETRMLMEKRTGSKVHGYSLCLSTSENEAFLT